MTIPSVPSLPLAWTCLLLASTTALLLIVRSTVRNRKLPPGPSPSWIPLAGNNREIQAHSVEGPWQAWAATELKAKHGDIITLYMTGKRTIVLNSLKAIQDLFNTETYSERPHFTVCGEIMGENLTTVLSPYGPYWKAHRRMYQSALGDSVLANHISEITEDESLALVTRLLNDASNPLHEVHLTGAKWILRVTYGMRINSLEEDFVRNTEAVGLDVSAAFRPGIYWADTFPIMKYIPSWFPGAGWKRHGLRLRKQIHRLNWEPHLKVKEAVDNGEDIPISVASKVIQGDLAGLECQVHLTGNMYGAGIHTNVVMMKQFLALMVTHPEVQMRAQKEIESVVGLDRLPNLNDKDSLHYVNAVVQEVFRFEAISPGGVAHRVSKDSEYRGFLIPKDTTVVANLWALTKDPSEYPDPQKFKPERFLEPAPSAKYRPPIDPRTYAFGVGRRSCPGRSISLDLQFLVYARLLAVFTIAQPLDKHGREYVPDVLRGRFRTQHIGVKDFPLRIIPRSRDLLGRLGVIDI